MLSLRVRELEEANATNQAATDILRGFIARGEAVQNEDGSVQIIRDQADDSLSEQYQMWCTKSYVGEFFTNQLFKWVITCEMMLQFQWSQA